MAVYKVTDHQTGRYSGDLPYHLSGLISGSLAIFFDQRSTTPLIEMTNTLKFKENKLHK